MNREQAKAWIKIFNSLSGSGAFYIIAQALGHKGFEKHYGVIKHFADGGEVERCGEHTSNWYITEDPAFLECNEYRKAKPKTHTVNGFEVPAPECDPLKDGQGYYMADPADENWYSSERWFNHCLDSVFLQRSLIFLAKEAATANAKAMCGIDPNGGDDE